MNLKFSLLFLVICLTSVYSADEESENNPLFIKDVESFQTIYDFVIIGGGGAGSVIANRLSEITQWKILLLEVGDNEDLRTDIPLLDNRNSSFDWNYLSEYSSEACKISGGVCSIPRGKALGGSSVIGSMVYTRGHPDDYNNWDLEAWNYKNVFPYFLKSEKIGIPDQIGSPHHNANGLLNIEYAPFKSLATDAFLEAGGELGFRNQNVDLNGDDDLGFQRAPATLREGKRCSVSKAFLHPVQHRSNLHISKNSLVTKILIDADKKVAHGVQFTKNGVTQIVKVKNEVILTAGAIASPQLLMLSGIGPREHLETLHIPVIQDLKVGYNHQDHAVFAPITYTINSNLPYPSRNEKEIPIEDYNAYNKLHNGPLTVPGGIEAIAFLQTKKDAATTVPDIEISCVGGKNEKQNQLMLVAVLLHPKSKGRITLRSNNPKDAPKIEANLFKEIEDVQTLTEGIRLALKIGETEAFKKINATLDTSLYAEKCGSETFGTDAYWDCAIRYIGSHGFHAVGTCKMGPIGDPDAVVDPQLLVRGIDNLRVADLSIAPQQVSAHTQSVSIMIGEKASDLIKDKWNNGGYCQDCSLVWNKLFGFYD